jgi:Transposase IS66 family
MKQGSEFKCTMVGAKITKLTSGNTAGRVDRWCLTSGLAGEREGPRRFLGNFEGLLQSDGYGGHDHIGGKGIVHAACWAHARRKFFDAVKLNPKDQTSFESRCR